MPSSLCSDWSSVGCSTTVCCLQFRCCWMCVSLSPLSPSHCDFLPSFSPRALVGMQPLCSRQHMVARWRKHHCEHTQQKALLCPYSSSMFVVPRRDEVVTALLRKKQGNQAVVFIGRALAYHTLAEWMGTCLLLLAGPWGDNSVLFTSSKRNFCFSSAGCITPGRAHGVHWPF